MNNIDHHTRSGYRCDMAPTIERDGEWLLANVSGWLVAAHPDGTIDARCMGFVATRAAERSVRVRWCGIDEETDMVPARVLDAMERMHVLRLTEAMTAAACAGLGDVCSDPCDDPDEDGGHPGCYTSLPEWRDPWGDWSVTA